VYRRIELISSWPAPEEDGSPAVEIKGGLCFIPAKEGVADAWTGLSVPSKRINKNSRFYFTEKGWDVYGRATIKACQRNKQRYRVLAMKEHSVDVVYRDENQVVVRPRKKTNSS
jgi:hypothetical protein